MPQSTHARASELHNLAIHAHQAAAVAHDKGDHLTAHELSKTSAGTFHERIWACRETRRRDSQAWKSTGVKRLEEVGSTGQ